MRLSPEALAWRDLRHEWQSAACFVAALVGVLAPLLILLALKNGVIDTLVGRLVENPANREIVPVGATGYDAAFFDAMASLPEVGFIMPATRRINATATAVRNPQTRDLERAVPLIGSASGDPLILGEPVAPGRVWLSSLLAQNLNISDGQTLEMLINREVDGNRETARAQLLVAGVLPTDNYARQAVFLDLSDLLAVEKFRDDLSISVDTYALGRAPPEVFASFRLYARDLIDLDPLLAQLKSRGIQARARAENAAMLLRFRDSLNLLYLVIACIALLGFWAAMASNLRGMVERQRVTFSLLRMLGMSPTACARVPLAQSLVLVGAGVILTLAIVRPTLAVINALFSFSSEEAIASLSVTDLLFTCALGLITAVSAAIWAIFAVAKIETQEVLRNA